MDNGKKVVILGFLPEDTEGIRKLFARLPAEAFYILSWGEKAKGEAFLKAASGGR